MPYARDDQPLPPILSDGVWTVPFEFFGAGTSAPLDQTGTTWSLVFAPKGRSQPAATDVHELTTAANGGITVSGNVVTVSWSTWASWAPGIYAVELRQTNLAAPIPVYVGAVTVARGLSNLPTLGGGSVLPPGTAPGVQIFVQSKAVQVVRGIAIANEAAAAASAASANAAWQAVDPVVSSVTPVVVPIPPGVAGTVFTNSASPQVRWMRNRGPGDASYVINGTATGASSEISLKAGEKIDWRYRIGLPVSVFSAAGTTIEGEYAA